MNPKLKITFCLLPLAFGLLAGCHQDGKIQDCDIEKPFPDVMVGVWEADEHNWVFRFEHDGTIKKIRHMLAGDSIIDDGGVYFEGPDEGAYALFVYGECTSEYDPCRDEINVMITLDKQEIQLPIGRLEGRAKDYFTGKVSEDGKTWVVRWRSYGWIEGATEPDPQLIEEKPIILTFTKVELPS